MRFEAETPENDSRLRALWARYRRRHQMTFEISLVPEACSGESQAAAGVPRAVLDPSRAVAPAPLNIDSSPSSRVLLDGKLLGITPIDNIEVEPGTHEVVFIHGVESQVKSITLTSGNSRHLQVQF